MTLSPGSVRLAVLFGMLAAPVASLQLPTSQARRAATSIHEPPTSYVSAVPSGADASVRNSEGLTVDDFKPLFSGAALGLKEMPDQQTSVLRQPDGNYLLFVTGVRVAQGPGGVTSLFTARDLASPKTYGSLGTVLEPSNECKSDVQCDPLNHGDNCAGYVGISSVFPAQNDLNHLLAFYIADQKIFADERVCHSGSEFYGQLGLATSTDGGRHWQKHGPILSGEPLPRSSSRKGPTGLNQPTVIKAGGYFYAYLDYFASGQWPASHPFRMGSQGLQVARAPIQADGLPGAWSKLYGGSFDSGQPGMNGLGDDVMPDVGGRHVGSMAWISFNTYLKKYLMTFVLKDGWYYSTLLEADLDKQNWSQPQKFFSVPEESNWVKGHPTWENMVFVTPGLQDNHVTGQEGLVIFSRMSAWAQFVRGKPREFAIGRFRFSPN